MSVPIGEFLVNRRVASFEAGDLRSFWAGDPSPNPAATCGAAWRCLVVVASELPEAAGPEQDANREGRALAPSESSGLAWLTGVRQKSSSPGSFDAWPRHCIAIATSLPDLSRTPPRRRDPVAPGATGVSWVGLFKASQPGIAAAMGSCSVYRGCIVPVAAGLLPSYTDHE